MKVNPWIPVLGLVCVLAAVMSLGRLHELQGADSIVPVLVSLQQWTPFFWLQDRFGMLVPLLVRPVHDPLINLVVQGWLMTTAALAAPFVCARVLVDDPRHWFVAGAVADVLVLTMPGPVVRFDWLVVQPYALSITLASAGLIAAAHRARLGRIAAALLMVLAHWVNVGVVVVVVPLVLLRRRFVAPALAATACGLGAGVALTRFSPYRTTTALVPPPEWPHAWFELLAKAPTAFPHPMALVVLTIASCAAVLVTLRHQSRGRGAGRPTHGWPGHASWHVERSVAETVDGRGPLAAAGIALFVAATYWLAAGTSRWVQINFYLPRYVYPSLLMSGVAVGLIAAALARGPSASIALAVSLALCTATIIDYGFPSAVGLRATIDARLGAMTPDVMASGATVIGGNYWMVWPAVFHANLAAYRQNGRTVYGLTYRSAPTDHLWKSGRPGILLAAPAGDRTIENFAIRAGLRIARVERRGTIDVFAIRASP